MTSVVGSSIRRTIRRSHLDCQDVTVNSTTVREPPLPAQRLWKEFAGQVFVVAAQLGEIGSAVALRIQIVAVEGADPLQERTVLVVAEVVVLAFAVPGVEGVVPDH